MGHGPEVGRPDLLGELPDRTALIVGLARRPLAGTVLQGDGIDLEVDGGINAETAALVAQAGANVLVAGNAIFAGNDAATYQPRIREIRDATAIRA